MSWRKVAAGSPARCGWLGVGWLAIAGMPPVEQCECADLGLAVERKE
jgi:hypothetical protein